jgi:hypothetical protein
MQELFKLLCSAVIGLFRSRASLAAENLALRHHLTVLLLSYMEYYYGARTHLALNKDAPASRAIQRVGRILPTPILGGLHHQCVRI